MQPFAHIQHKSLAKIFISYLNSCGIRAKLTTDTDSDADNESLVLWCDTEHLAQAQREFEQFIQNPTAERYQASAWHSGASLDLSSTGSWASLKQSFISNAGPFTLLIFALCWLVFIATVLVLGDSLYQLLLINQYGDLQQTLQQPWRFITPAVFHYSLLHIAFNTMWWWQLGGQIERHVGSRWLIALFLVSALISNLSQFFVSGPSFAGLSGVVYAVFGFVWWFGYLNPGRGIGLSQPIIGFMLFWLVLGFTDFMPINVANTAHFMGLLCGVAFAFICHQRNAKV
ncbi:rhomboid family intramembrane serine protease GlpG [Thalassotalea ponticola]|uniref:rhomboid family intramembrane serine protease GlpG n=1 Tax=Thalassotalea ponticola TaxID=1523392 RepID=UPI0025B31E3F|nr:rhomboid family intramembrane serine protease GlpG [Thalassotalea ponticola]MDN3652791.1 rhomboid family intramembrane serine protease GlpG [Thalassotalea ponticola]